jgi:3,4-dihydroxy 2-butanone 4-phosphate synthase/GTP cyclohydrolase II
MGTDIATLMARSAARDATTAQEPFAAIDAALAAFAAGRPVVVVPDEEPSNEGVLIQPAIGIVADDINFMTRKAGGWIHLALTTERCAELGLELMAGERPGGSIDDIPFTVTIEARDSVTTGISTADQATTIRTAADPANAEDAIVTPGHVRPLRARLGGVLARAGHSEAATDLARLAGLVPAAVICDVQNADGAAAKLPDLVRFASDHGFLVITIADLIAYRRHRDVLVERVDEQAVISAAGSATLVTYRCLIDDARHVALCVGDIAGAPDVLVRVQAASELEDLFGPRPELDASLGRIRAEGRGVLVHLRGTPAEDDPLRFGIGAQILHDLGLGSVRLLTDHDHKLPALGGFGLTVSGQVALGAAR